MAFEHLVVLTSSEPTLDHSHAARTVCGALIREFESLVPKVTVKVFESRAPEMERATTLDRAIRASRLLLGDGLADRPRLADEVNEAHAIDACGADRALLFWDTLAEWTLPYLKTPAYGYLARPPHASALVNPANTADRLILKAMQRRHFRRMSLLKDKADICALDAKAYKCRYIPNTWPDTVGPNWAEKRDQIEGTQIIGNLGSTEATGNRFGFAYLSDSVLPALLSVASDIDWTIAICGTGKNKLYHPRIAMKGFVDDIDTEMLSSPVFLMCNNAGPYTGGYSRIVYACSTGACIIAHRNLAKSMPELKGGLNCLLFDTPEQCASMVEQALLHKEMRRWLGARARLAYDRQYAPRLVAARLLDMMQ